MVAHLEQMSSSVGAMQESDFRESGEYMDVFPGQNMDSVQAKDKLRRRHASSVDKEKTVAVPFRTSLSIDESTGGAVKSTCRADNVDVPWFPRHVSDLDQLATHVMTCDNQLEADHPGFCDEVYKLRRHFFTEVAFGYKSGEPIPRISYTPEETQTWSVIFSELEQLYDKHACQEFKRNLQLLKEKCGYRVSNVPQLQDVSSFLLEQSGFCLRPVAGYLSARDFLAGLALKVFHCTQYIRHSSDPFYTPEPDCCHELLGHMPLLADPTFAQFSQEIGLASLGASDSEVERLATCYFFSVEFGLCKENGELKAFGAGLLSSAGELRHATSPAAIVDKFDPQTVCYEECAITTFQKRYFYTDTFSEAKESMRKFAKSIQRSFDVRFDPITLSIEMTEHSL